MKNRAKQKRKSKLVKDYLKKKLRTLNPNTRKAPVANHKRLTNF